MSKRQDVIGADSYDFETTKSGLIYTKLCGWIDLGHAYPSNGKGDGAAYLWRKIVSERNEGNPSSDTFTVKYQQKMSAFRRNLSVGILKKYSIRKGLNIVQKRAVFLSIVLDVSNDFEALQANWLFSKLTNSGFSAEDLISNLISVYRSINPNVNYIDHCKPVDKTTALQIWDNYGEIGNIKNSTLSPYLFPLNAKGKPEKGALPDFLNTINILKAESLYEEVK
ncbi:hypothetical protein Q4498_05410 [Neptunomonas phycophila]|uniref:hypothetical protein n=1 Tax=Neptunomonas phycophila TaxID=1572645 RepID=UPI0026E29AC7|nr:hypothetical protein [Neptunomonas phycophila]MDO6467547.1 hypothetical protein [Neptunomonas phycophila]